MSGSTAAPSSSSSSLLHDHLFFAPDPNAAGALRDSKQLRMRSPAIGTAASGTRGPEKPMRDPFFLACVEALRYMLLVCPAAIEKYTSFWISQAPIQQDDLMFNITFLLQAFMDFRPNLQFRIKRGTDMLGRSIKHICGISFLRDLMRKAIEMEKGKSGRHASEFDFECDDALLLYELCRFEPHLKSDVVNARFATVLMHLETHKERGGFLQMSETIGSTVTTVLNNFESNDILGKGVDGSAWFVSLILQLLSFGEALFKDKVSNGLEDEADTSSKNASKRLLSMAEAEDARVMTATEIFNFCNDFIHKLRYHCRHIALPSIQLPKHLRTYRPHLGLTDSEDFLYGVPIEVACCEDYTYLWLEWIWCDHPRQIKETQKKDADSEDELPFMGMRRVMADLWRAKCVLLTDEYETFFAQWDQQWLRPVIQEALEAQRQANKIEC